MKTIELFDKIDQVLAKDPKTGEPVTRSIEDERWPNAMKRYRITAYLKNQTLGEDRYEGREKPSQPYNSWAYEDGVWTPPTPKPGDNYTWNEELQKWEEHGPDTYYTQMEKDGFR